MLRLRFVGLACRMQRLAGSFSRSQRPTDAVSSKAIRATASDVYSTGRRLFITILRKRYVFGHSQIVVRDHAARTCAYSVTDPQIFTYAYTPLTPASSPCLISAQSGEISSGQTDGRSRPWMAHPPPQPRKRSSLRRPASRFLPPKAAPERSTRPRRASATGTPRWSRSHVIVYPAVADPKKQAGNAIGFLTTLIQGRHNELGSHSRCLSFLPSRA